MQIPSTAIHKRMTVNVQSSPRALRSSGQPTPAARCRRRFLRFFPGGFHDDTYLDWERNYKAEAHSQWVAELGASQFRELLKARRFREVATRAIRIESRTNLLFSFEKMALRDAVRTTLGARTFTKGLYAFLHGRGHVLPQDVKDLALDVLRHRVILTYEAEAEEKTSDDVIHKILDAIPVP